MSAHSGLQILVVDDDDVTRRLLCEVLEREGHSVQLAASGEDAVAMIQKTRFPIILSDMRMLELDGMAVLRAAKRAHSQTAVILMTGFGSMEGAIKAIQEGAFDYVSKPFQMNDLRAVVARASKHWESLQGMRGQVAQVPLERTTKTLIGKSPNIVEVYKTLARAAMSASTVLVMGESGTGKELVARAIHDNSSRRDRRFIAVNCGALAENLLESELFGHIKGSFTGAISDKRGLFEEASGGTLFLDEIGDISSALQIKLLRVLQENEFKAVGSVETKKSNVRLITATHRDLETLVRTGKFRDDLYYRLKVISIELPPLRNRMEDLPELVEHFLARYSERNKKRVSHVADEAMDILKAYHWPGNIRELEHAIERAVAMTNTSVLFPEDFPPEVSRHEVTLVSGVAASTGGTVAAVNVTSATSLMTPSLEEMERSHIVKILHETQFNKSKASEILGIDRATLYRKAQRYGIELRGK